MKRLLCLVLLAGCLGFSGRGFSQSWEIGLTPGVSYYVGDLNPVGHFRFSHPAGGIFARKNLNWHWAVRMGFNYNAVSATDSLASYEYQQFRNLSFQSHVFELNALVELNFFPYKPQELKRFRWTPYLFAGLAAFYYQPQTMYNGTLVNLDEYGTEGQFLDGGPKRYSRVQPAFPFGMGVKVNLSRRLSFGAEWGMRLLFTDYLDDVSTVYPDANELLVVGGQAAVELSDPSEPGDGSHTGFQRGFSKTKDWYSFLGISLVFAIDDPAVCPGYANTPRKPWFNKKWR